jgi:energy-coupling factor transporter ATP-binding protein EcfA2
MMGWMNSSGLHFDSAEIVAEDGKAIVGGLTFTVAPGQMAAVVGANGSGKTAVLLACCGVLNLRGQAELHGHDLTTAAGRTAVRGKAVLVPEDMSDFFLTSTVEQELELTARLQGWSKHEIVEKVQIAWEGSGIGGDISRPLAGLGRGEMLRTVLAVLGMMAPWLTAWDGVQRQLDDANRALLMREWKRMADSGTMVLISCLREDEVPADVVIRLGETDGGR